jgi:hypothetical protein
LTGISPLSSVIPQIHWNKYPLPNSLRIPLAAPTTFATPVYAFASSPTVGPIATNNYLGPLNLLTFPETSVLLGRDVAVPSFGNSRE